MSGLSPAFINEFRKESWSLYGTGMIVIILRTIAQIFRNHKLRSDDFVMLFAACWYTLLCVALNNIVEGGGSNFMSEADILALTPATHDARVRGAKWVFVSEQSLMATMWLMKGCMLIVYWRLTEGLKQRRYIFWLTVYTYVGYVIVQIAYFSMCRPFMDYFVVPPPPGQDQCASYLNVLIIQGCFNVTSDIGVLLVGIPLLLMVRVPIQQKLGVVVVFGMAVFVIVAAILNKVYSTLPSLTDDSVTYTSWYMRESTVGVYVINLPSLWPILRKFLPMITGKGSSATRSNDPTSGVGHSKSWLASRRRTQIDSHVKNDAFEMGSKRRDIKDDLESDDGSASNVGRSYANTSQEHIIESGKGGFNSETSVLEIGHDVTYTVEHSHAPGQPARSYSTNVQAGVSTP